MAAFLPGYSTRRKITIQHTLIDADLTDFPVDSILRSHNFDFAKSLANGHDIRFCGSDGTTLLSFERGRHEQANSRANYQTKIPAVSSTAPTDFYIYYRTEPTADGTNPTAVWDVNTMARWSLKEDPIGTAPPPHWGFETTRDSTVNANHGSSFGSIAPTDSVEGKIGRALDFDGVNNRIQKRFPVGTSSPNGTISAWVNVRTLPPLNGVGGIVGIYENSTTFDMIYVGAYNPNGALTFVIVIRDANTTRVTAYTGAKNLNQFYHLSFTGGTGGNKLSVDGVEQTLTYITGSPSNTEWTDRIFNDFLMAGARRFNGPARDFFDGLIDEVRISNIARSSAWKKASFNSGNNTLLTYGAEETPVVTTYQPRGTSLSSPYMY